MNDFNAMPRAELRAYIVSHPQDKAAFYTFVDRFATSVPPTKVYPPLESMDDIDRLENIFRKKLERPEDEE
jgi:hypothetical protein